MSWSSRISSGLVMAAVLGVAACSGGGSSTPATSTSSGGSSGGSSSGGSGTATTASVARQKTVASSALQAASSSVDYNQFGSNDGSIVFAIEAAESATGQTQSTTTSSCRHGQEFAYESTGTGTGTVTIDTFYDPSCTQPYKTTVLNITFSSSGGTATGNEDVYSQSDTLLDYKTYAITFVNGDNKAITSLTVLKTIAATAMASPYASVGFSCVYGADHANNCGSGNTIAQPSASPSPFSVGFEETTVASVVTPAASASPTASATPSASASASPGTGNHGGNWNGFPTSQSQITTQIAGAGYIGALGGLTLAPGETPAWTISGGTQVTTLTGTATSGFGGMGMGGQCGAGTMASLSLTLTDTADSLVATLSSSGNKLTGNVTQSGTNVATISLDRSGTGTITYIAGGTSAVDDWVIVD